MRIFLLNPEPPYYRRGLVLRRNRVWPPISLAIIAAGLEKAGHDVRLHDANVSRWSNRRIMDELSAYGPDLLIFSTDRHDAWQLPVPDHGYIEQFFADFEAQGTPAERILVIGPHGTLYPDALIDHIPSIDFVIRGEPEEKTLAFVEALADGDPFDAGGLTYRCASGNAKHNPDPGFIRDLDALPLPAYHLLPMHDYRDNTAPDHRFGLVVTSRGCPMACIFCSKSMYGNRFRTRSVGHVLDEVDLLVKKYGVKRIFFHDQILLHKRKRIETLLDELIRRRYGITWRCQTRLANLDREILERMAKAGCTEVHVGLESISAEVRKAVKKNDQDRDRFLKLNALGEELGVRISPNMIIGLPGETYESVLETARFYTDMGFPFLPNVAIPYPDTKLYDMGCEEGKIRSGDWSSIVDAAGRAGNALSLNELKRILRDVDRLNMRLHMKRLTPAQRLRKTPQWLLRRLKGWVRERMAKLR